MKLKLQEKSMMIFFSFFFFKMLKQKINEHRLAFLLEQASALTTQANQGVFSKKERKYIVGK